MNHFSFFLLLLLLPAFGKGQLGCDDEQIVSLELNLITVNPSFSHGIIVIACESEGVHFRLKTFNTKDELIESERHLIPSLLYKEFKAAALPLEIKSIVSLSNLYLIDGLETEIVFQDRYGNVNRFETRVPAVRGRNLYLIESIIELANALPISPHHQAYLKSLYDNYLVYCRE